MKELSIEEKATRYDEAIEQLRAMMPNWENLSYNGKTFLQDLVHIIPELKESDDERIKRVIKQVLSESTTENDECYLDNGVTQQEVFAWLERQGEHANFCNKIQIGDKVTRNEDGVLVNLSQLNRVAKKVEKQGEKKPIMIQWQGNNLKEVIDFTGKDKNFEKWFKSFEEYEKYVHEHNDIFKLFNEDGSHYEVPVGAWIVKTPDGYNVASKAALKQKPIDKVEPKFKVGDWVVRNGETLQISGIDTVSDGTFHYWFTKGTWLSSKKMGNAMLWTIQDAKDGDVLSYRDGQWSFIYKGIVTGDTFKYYALLSEKGITLNDAAFSLLSSCITPATKEQRDQLEKAMADAGYEWDAEHKQLKKIEQNPTDEVGNYDHKEVLQTIIKEQKPAWSEEDDNVLVDIEHAVQNYWPGDTPNDLLDWLESIKDRVQPQPKQEWSEEDEKKRKRIMHRLSLDGTINNKDLADINDWLKSLKDRYTWKPSDEQMFDLKCAADSNTNVLLGQSLLSLYSDLKKL